MAPGGVGGVRGVGGVVLVKIGVVDGVVGIMYGGDVGHTKSSSESLPVEVIVTKPGWSVVMWLLIQFWKRDTRAKTVGKSGKAQRTAKLTTPDWTQ